MVRTKRPPEETEIDYEAIIARLFLILGLALLLLGSLGLLLSLLAFSKTIEDKILLSEMYFFYTYMIILGAVLFLYHERIIVKGYRT